MSPICELSLVNVTLSSSIQNNVKYNLTLSSHIGKSLLKNIEGFPPKQWDYGFKALKGFNAKVEKVPNKID